MSLIILNVDEVRRTLSASGGNFVTHDKEVDIVRFAINSGFADIVLDGQVALRVMYQRPGESQVRAQTLTYYDTDGLHNYYDWQLSQSDLAKNGSLMVALCILRTDSEVEEWHTTPCQVRVLDTIHTDDSDEADESITPTVAERVAVLETMIQRVASGAPIVVASTSAMTDTDQIYVLSTNGNWYYYNGTAWTVGGEYGAVATDTTLTQAGIPADAKVAGDKTTNLKEDLFSLGEGFEEFDTTFIRGSLSDSGEINLQARRIVTQDILHFDYPIFIKDADTNFNYKVALYDENGTFTAFLNGLGWLTAQCFIPANTYFRLTIAKVVETSDPADIDLFRTKVLKQTNYNYLVDSVLSYKSTEVLNYHLKKRILFKNYNASQGKFVIGGYRTIDTPIYYPFDIIVNNANSELYMFNVKIFTDKEPVAANYFGTSGWIKTDNGYRVPKNTYFTVEYTTKDVSVTPLPSMSTTLELLTFTPVGVAEDIVYGAVDMVIRETDGFYSTDGSIIPTTAVNKEVFTQKYPTQKGMGYNVSLAFSIVRTMWGAYALYDENENFISRTVFANLNTAKKVFNIVVNDDNAAYISFCYRTYGDLTINIASFDFNKISTRGVDLLDRKMRSYDYSVNEHIKSINHRGYNTEAPENTLPAYKLSRQHGYKYVECDVSFTSDDVAVLLHDATINRTARNEDGTEIADTIYIQNITYEQALTYDFGIRKGGKWAGVKIPTFEQFISLCRNIGLHPYIEIKSQGMTESHVNQIVDIVRNCGMANEVTWISFTPEALQYVIAKNPKARIGVLANTVDATVITTAEGLMTNNNDVFINSGSYTDSEVALCQNANIPMEVWNFASQNVMASLPVYVSGITSDIYVAGYVLYRKNISI